MTVKIVRGTIPQDTAAKNVLQPNTVAAASTQLSRAAGFGQQQAVSDAATTFVRSSKGGTVDRLRDPEQATKLADNLAEKIRSEGSSEDHSYISNSVARTHFVN